jgi:hypothetical protein
MQFRTSAFVLVACAQAFNAAGNAAGQGKKEVEEERVYGANRLQALRTSLKGHAFADKNLVKVFSPSNKQVEVMLIRITRAGNDIRVIRVLVTHKESPGRVFHVKTLDQPDHADFRALARALQMSTGEKPGRDGPRSG